MKTSKHSMKLWTTLCTLVCLLIGGGTANAEGWTYSEIGSESNITRTVGGVEVKIKVLPIGEGILSISHFGETDGSNLTALDLSGDIKDASGTEYKITDISYSFTDWTKLTTLTLPASVTMIKSSFNNASALKKITYLGTKQPKFSSLEPSFTSGPEGRVLNIPNAEPANDFTNKNWGVAEIIAATPWIYDGSGTITHTNGLVLTVTNTEGKLTVTGVSGDVAVSGVIELTGRIADAAKNPFTITAIGREAFSNKTAITSMVLPNTVVSIGENAFKGCSGMTGIVYEGVTEIGSNAFDGCEKLVATMPKGLTTIGRSAFTGTAITGTLTLPASLTTIGADAFSACSKITAVALPDNITVLSDSLFSGCSKLASIPLGKVTSIGNSCFPSTALTSADLSAVTTIGKNAFRACGSLEKITLNGSTTAIAEGAFGNCGKLVSITCPTTTEPTMGQSAFTSGPTTGRKVYAFKANPKNWTKANWGADEVIYAFDWTLNEAQNALTSSDGKITLGVTQITSVPGVIDIKITSFTGDTTAINLEGTVGDANKKTYLITEIGKEAFKDKVLDELTLPATITAIQSDAFSGGTVYNLVLKGKRPTIGSGTTIVMKDSHLCLMRVPDDKLDTYHVENAGKTTYTNWGGLPYIVGEKNGILADIDYDYSEGTPEADVDFPAFKPIKVPVGQLFQFVMKAVNSSCTLRVEGLLGGTTAANIVSYKDSIVSIKLMDQPVGQLKLKLTLIKPITTPSEGIFIKDETYKVGDDGTYNPYSAQIGDGTNALNVSKLTFETPTATSGAPAKQLTIAVKQVTVAPGATTDAVSTSVQADANIKLTLFGANSFGRLENKGMLNISPGDSTAQIDVENTRIVNDSVFADYTGQIRSVISNKAPLIINTLSSSKRIETVASNDTITLTAVATAIEGVEPLYTWQHLVDGKWTEVSTPAPAANSLRADAPLPNTLVVAAANVGDYRCLIEATEQTSRISTLLSNYTTVKVLDPVLKPITTSDKDIYIKDNNYKAGTDGTYGPYSAQIGDGETALNVSKLTFETPSTPSKMVSIAVKKVTVAPATGKAISTSVQADANIELTLFGANSFGTLQNKGILTLKAGDNTAQINVANTSITNDSVFADYTGQIRTVAGAMPLTIQASSSKRNETVIADGTVTLKADVVAAENAKVTYKWERLVEGEWKATDAAEPAANDLKAESLPNTLVVAAANIGDYRCLITAVGVQTSTLLCNYTTVTVSGPTPPPYIPTYYSINFIPVEGAMFIPEAGAYVVEEGNDFSFTLILEEGYKNSTPIVKANDVVITPRKSDGKYIISNIYEDMNVVIKGVTKDNPTGNAEIDNDAIRIRGIVGTLLISTPQPASLEVYTISGNRLHQSNISAGDSRVQLPAGLYIIRIGDYRQKVFIR